MYTAKIFTNEVNYFFFDEALSNKALGMIGKVKKEVSERYTGGVKWSKDRVKFCVYNKFELKPDTYIPNVIEVDVKAAYLTTAFNMGLISEKLFKELQTLKKIERLKVMGAMAVNKWVFEYRNGKEIKFYQECNEHLRSAWFNICYRVDKLLVSIKHFLRNRFLFYYVDGIYFTPSTITDIDDVCNIISAHGYDFKVKQCSIEVTPKQNLIVYDENGKRPFYIPKRSVRKIAYF
jgi:hypothetical protein